MTRVLITGGNGFIAGHLAERLLARGDPVTMFDVAFDRHIMQMEACRVEGDVTDYPTVAEAVSEADAVFHLASVSRVAWGQRDPFTCWRTNVLGTMNALEACRRSPSRPLFFFASSTDVYGESRYLPVDEAHPKDPISVYGTTKWCGESACRAYGRPDAYGRSVRAVRLRFPNVYGSERDLRDRVVPKFMARALRNEEITLYGGAQVLDFTFIGDAVAGALQAYDGARDGRDGVVGEAFQFVTGTGVSVAELAERIVGITGSSSRIVEDRANAFDVQHFTGTPEKAHRILGYAAKTDLDTGLRHLLERWTKAGVTAPNGAE